MYFNARSITNKVDELQLYINDENPDVIGITETWLHEDIFDSELNAFDDTIYRHDRNNKQGGGTALLIKKSINSILRDDLINDFEEGIWCDIICIIARLAPITHSYRQFCTSVNNKANPLRYERSFTIHAM